MAFAMYGNNTESRRKKVYFEGTDTVFEGIALCYNQDTTTNIIGYSKSEGGEVDAQTTPTTTAEGSQNEGKYLRVEKPATANLPFFAGVVAPGSWVGKAGPCWLEVYIPNGAIVPVRATDNHTIGELLYIANADYEFTSTPQIGGYCAVCMETVDRSTTEGLVLAKLLPTNPGVKLTTVTAKTHAASPVALTIADAGKIFTNTGATNTVEFDLPAAATCTGCEFTFSVTAAYAIAIDPNGSEVISFGNDTDALGAGEALTLTPADANDVGMNITLVSNGTGWITKSAYAQGAAKFVIP